MTKPQPVFYTFSGVTGFAKGADGPVLAEGFIEKAGFTPTQVTELNKMVAGYYREFLSLERQHSDFTRDAQGHVHVTITPFPEESLALARRAAAELRGLLGKEVIPEPRAGQLMSIGLFRHAGEYKVTAELWKNGEYHFNETLEGVAPANGKLSRGGTGKTASEAFPEEYQVYWKE
jgi:hypothetical protein